MGIKIIEYQPRYASDFYNLNIEWLKTFFYVEAYDQEVLSNPEKHIVNKGGFIFFALKNEIVVGAFALMPTEIHGILELTKMAVSPKYRGRKIGQQLLKFSINFAKKQQLKALMLYSNTRLENAIYLYRKYGFIEQKLEEDNPYQRADIKMLLEL